MDVIASLPVPLGGEIWLEPAGLVEATGGGEGPGRMLETRGELCGENADWVWLPCSP